MEAQESLGLDEEMGDSWLEKEEFSKKIKSLTQELDEMKESRIVYIETYNDADDCIEEWEVLKSSIQDGKTCFAPKAKGLKKKRKGKTNQGARKKQRRSKEEDSFDEDSEDSETSEEDAEDSSEEEGSREPLTEEQVTAKLLELRETKREAKRQKSELTDKITLIRKEINEATISEKKIEAEMSALCISGRNQYSKGAIQHVCECALPSMVLSKMFSITVHLLILSCRTLQRVSKSSTKKWPLMKMKRTSIPNLSCGITMKLHVVYLCFVCHLEDIKSYRDAYATIQLFQVSRQLKKPKSPNSKLIVSN